MLSLCANLWCHCLSTWALSLQARELHFLICRTQPRWATHPMMCSTRCQKIWKAQCLRLCTGRCVADGWGQVCCDLRLLNYEPPPSTTCARTRARAHKNMYWNHVTFMQGARIISNSWGYADFQYSAICWSLDAYLFMRPDLLAFHSAGTLLCSLCLHV